jgi:hypothetical protein
LEDDRVEVKGGGFVEEDFHLPLLIRDGEGAGGWPVDIVYRGYPGGAELAGDRR